MPKLPGTTFSGALMRRERLRQGLTQYDLADRSGYTQAEISMWETGRYRPCHFAMLVLAKSLETECGAFTPERACA